MSPQDYNNNSYRQLAQGREQAIATVMPDQDELLSGSESALILAALCTLVVSILAVSIL
jgi:cell division protein FtsL